MLRLCTAIFILLLSAKALDGQVCAERSPKQLQLRKKMDTFMALVDKLLCLDEEPGTERVETTTVHSKKTKAPTTVTSTTLKSTTAEKTEKLSDEMCGRRFVPVSGPNAKTVHCWINARMNTSFLCQHLDANLCTHAQLFSFFSIDADYTVTLRPEYKDDFQHLMHLLKSKNVSVLTSLGEEEGFDVAKYSKMASSEANRTKFTTNVIETLSKYELNGLLVNWNYPVAWHGNVNKLVKKDFDNYPLLMKALSEKLKEKTMALHAMGTNLVVIGVIYNFEKLKGMIDMWHLNIYHYEGWWSPSTAIASPISRIIDLVKSYAKYVPSQTLAFGIPLYNTPMIVKDKTKTKLNSLLKAGDSWSPKLGNFVGLCNEAAKGVITVVHNERGTPNTYAYSNEGHWVSYESTLVVAAKTQYAIDKNLAGVFVKHLGEDDVDGKACKCGKFHMLRAVNEGLRGDGSCIPPVCPN